MRTKSICLNMIVKNESDVIERCLMSVMSLIDYWVIVDTGSSDGTQAIVKKILKDVPGVLYERPWVNFAHNRNEALSLAKKSADYLLFIDADEQLLFSEGFQCSDLDRDAYFVMTHQGGYCCTRFFLVGNHVEWGWVGVLHEQLICYASSCTSEIIKGVINCAEASDGSRSRDPKKHHKDAELLERAIAEDPMNSRYVFYLARTYQNAKEYSLALKNFEKRSNMGGCPQETFFSLYKVGVLQQLLNKDPTIFLKSYLAAHQYRCGRVEPLYEIAAYYYTNQSFFLSYLILFYALSISEGQDSYMEWWIYDWGLLFQYALSAYQIGLYEEANDSFQKLLSNVNLPDEKRRYITSFSTQSTRFGRSSNIDSYCSFQPYLASGSSIR
jgi:glycosyltransferase involved in cell wall biosynthesis